MSILYSKKGRGIIKWIWVFFATLLILSMIFAFSGSIELFSPNNINQNHITNPESTTTQTSPSS